MWKKKILSELTDILSNSPTLYKFIGSTEVVQTILTDSQLQLNNPQNFNDPFDCYKELITFDQISKRDLARLKEKYSSTFPTAIKKINQALKNSSTNEISGAYKKFALNKTISEIGITCFSRDYRNNLMWSHYGKSHSGICIGFDIAKMYTSLENIQDTDKSLLKVDYERTFEAKDFFKDSLESILYWLKTKSIDWDYENEVRLIYTKLTLNNDGKRLIKIAKESFKEIIFGFNSSIEKNRELIEFVRTYYPDIEMYKMQPSSKSFELQRKKI